MNAKQRNQNRGTAQNLRYALAKWDSRNRRMVPVKAQQPVQQKAA